jgi:hypothetical protein
MTSLFKDKHAGSRHPAAPLSTELPALERVHVMNTYYIYLRTRCIRSEGPQKPLY